MSEARGAAGLFGDGGFDARRFIEFARQVGHGRALGMNFEASGEDWAELSLPWREELVGVAASGILASGAIVSLIDTACGTAVWSKLRTFRPLVTLDLRIDYLRPALKGETVFARCECAKLTRHLAFTRGIAHTGDAERPIARAAGTFVLNR